jgi:hypothetical protein
MLRPTNLLILFGIRTNYQEVIYNYNCIIFGECLLSCHRSVQNTSILSSSHLSKHLKLKYINHNFTCCVVRV